VFCKKEGETKEREREREKESLSWPYHDNLIPVQRAFFREQVNAFRL